MTITSGPDPAVAVPESLSADLLAQGVRGVFGFYVDLFGVPKAKCVPVDHLHDWARGSELYTVGALEGMGALGPNEDECVSMPDLSRVVVLPWDRRFAVAPAELYFDGAPYTHDARHVLRRQVEEAAELGFDINLGVEPEVYVLRREGDDWVPFVEQDVLNEPTRGYDLETTILASSFLLPMVEYMNELGWDVYSFDHEGGDGQYEFDFRYADALTMADRMVVFRLMAKHVARTVGATATFMPKPWSTAFGSGAHYNISLADPISGRNLFADADADHGYSALARQFTAGVIEHAEAITAIVCPTTNSYKRLTPRGLMNEMSWAPVYRAYGNNNRTLMCRLPMNRRCLELRHADSASNLYLGAAITIAAGLDGIRRGLELGEPVDFNTYDLPERELRERGIERLPRTLGEAVDALEVSDLASAVLGEQFHADTVDHLRSEWEQYCLTVDAWERDRYLHRW